MIDDREVPEHDELSHRIRGALTAFTGDVDNDDATRRIRGGVRRRRGARVASVLAATVAVGAVAAAALTRASDGPSDTVAVEQPDRGGSTTSSAAPPRDGVAVPALDDWSDTGVDAATFGSVTITEAVSLGGKVVAVGCRREGDDASGFPAWVRALDGAWTRAAASEDVDCLDHVAATPFGLFASGVASLWRSADGREWERVGLPSREYRVVDTGRYGPVFVVDDRVTVARWTPAPAESTVASLYSTTDGYTWTAYRAEATLFDDATVAAVTSTAGGLLAVGASPGGEFVPTAAAWTSPDGLLWTRVTPSEAEFENAFMTDVVRTDDGYLAVGGDSFQSGLMVAWTSPDGVDWRRSPSPDETLDPDTAYMRANAVTRVGDEYFAAGEDFDAARAPESIPALWASPDGVTWRRLDLQDDALIPFEIVALDDTGLGFWPPPYWPAPSGVVVLGAG